LNKFSEERSLVPLSARQHATEEVSGAKGLRFVELVMEIVVKIFMEISSIQYFF